MNKFNKYIQLILKKSSFCFGRIKPTHFPSRSVLNAFSVSFIKMKEAKQCRVDRNCWKATHQLKNNKTHFAAPLLVR